MLCLLSLESRIAADHPLRGLKALADAALRRLSADFDAMYADCGRPSIPPERLLKALLLIALHSVRSERQFCEQLEYNCLVGPTGPGNLLFRYARLMRKGKGREAKLSFGGHALVENRHGLLVDLRVSEATGRSERQTAIEMLAQRERRRRITVAADRGYDSADFVRYCRNCRNISGELSPKYAVSRFTPRTGRSMLLLAILQSCSRCSASRCSGALSRKNQIAAATPSPTTAALSHTLFCFATRPLLALHPGRRLCESLRLSQRFASAARPGLLCAAIAHHRALPKYPSLEGARAPPVEAAEIPPTVGGHQEW
jgi:hypothetical protein